MYVYIPRSWIIGFFCAAFGLAAGWLLHTSAREVATSREATSEAWNDVPASSAPPIGASTVVRHEHRDHGNARQSGGRRSARRRLLHRQLQDASRADGHRASDRIFRSGVTHGQTHRSPRVLDPARRNPWAGRAAAGRCLRALTPLLAHGPGHPRRPDRPTPGRAAHPSAEPDASTLPFFSASQVPFTVTSAQPSATVGQSTFQIPPFLPADLFKPLPGATTRGVAFSEWESYRTDLAGRNIIATTDDSNVFVNRNGKLNGNTGDTDASGLNIVDATDSVIRGTESADEAPWQTVAQALVDMATGSRAEPPGGDDPGSDDDDDGDADDPDPGANGEDAPEAPTTSTAPAPAVSGSDPLDTDTGDRRFATSAPGAAGPVAMAAHVETDASGESDSANSGYDFPYVTWLNSVNGGAATAVHTDEGHDSRVRPGRARHRGRRLRRRRQPRRRREHRAHPRRRERGPRRHR